MAIEVEVATTSSALAEGTSSEMRGTRNPSGMNIAKFPPIVWRQKAVVEGCPGLGTKHPIDWSTGTRLIPKDPFAVDIDGGARVNTPSRTRLHRKGGECRRVECPVAGGPPVQSPSRVQCDADRDDKERQRRAVSEESAHAGKIAQSC